MIVAFIICGAAIAFIIFVLWCCCKVAGDADEKAGNPPYKIYIRENRETGRPERQLKWHTLRRGIAARFAIVHSTTKEKP